MDLGKTVRQIEREVDSAELSEWLAFWRVEPRWSPWHALAQVLATLVNIHRGKGARARKPAEFLPKGMRRERQTPAQMAAAMRVFAAAQNGNA